MSSDIHERARTLVAIGGVSAADRRWLAEHLDSCSSCSEFAARSNELVRSLRSMPVTATASLVAETRMRVRQRARELQRQQERRRVVFVCCAAVALCSVLTAAASWEWSSWIASQAQISAPVWQTGLLVFGLMPAVVIGILLLARGTYLADYEGHGQ